MKNLTTSETYHLVGMHPVTLDRRCQQLGFGRARQGARREFSLEQVCTLALAAELVHNHLVPPVHAASIAASVDPDIWATTLEFEAEGVWLLAAAKPPRSWLVTIIDSRGCAKAIVNGHQGIVIDLRPIARRLRDATALDTPGAGHA